MKFWISADEQSIINLAHVRCAHGVAETLVVYVGEPVEEQGAAFKFTLKESDKISFLLAIQNRLDK